MGIERRKSKRISINTSSKVELNGEVFEGIIGNISDDGVGYLLTTYIESDKKLIPRENINLTIRISAEETIRLECEIRWFIKPSETKKSLIIGVQLVDPPERYKEWIQEIEARQNSRSF